MVVDKETKSFDLVQFHPSKELWDYKKKKKCNNIIIEWQTIFKTSKLKGKFFLLLLTNNLSEIELAYILWYTWTLTFFFSFIYFS